MLWPHWELADVIALVADGIATHVWADVFAQCSKWNSHMWQLMNYFVVADGKATLWLPDVIAMVADGIATGWNVSM